MKNLLLSTLTFALLGCGGNSNDRSSADQLAGAYTGTFIESTPATGTVTGTVALNVANNGTVSGTATDSRYVGTGTVAAGSTIGSDGTTVLIVSYPNSGSAVTTTAQGALSQSGTSLIGTLIERDGAVNVTFGYQLARSGS